MAYILAADIGGTSCKLAIFNEDIEVVHKWRIASSVGDYKDMLGSVTESFRTQLEKIGSSFKECIGLGVGVPGPVDFESGTVNGAVNLGWETHVPVGDILSKLTGLTVRVDNDANMAALGEQYKGAGKNDRHVAVLTLGTGVGGGIIINRELIHGHAGAGGEVGHMKVDHTEQFLCNCGHRGCLETVASATGIVNLTYALKENFPNSSLSSVIDAGTLTSKDVIQAAADKDQLALHILNKASFYIALGMSYIASTVNPSRFVIGGGVSAAGTILLDSIISQFPSMTFPPAAENVNIVLAELGNDAGMYGAARIIEQYVK